MFEFPQIAESSGRLVAVFAVSALCTFRATSGMTAENTQEGAPGESESRVTLAAESGWERIGEDSYVASALKFGLKLPVPEILCTGRGLENSCGTSFRAGLQAPLRLRVVDRAPGDAGLVRRADWDEPSDYLRIVRYIEYGDREAALSARVGELGSYRLGHGTIVNDYFNVVTPDQHRTGASVRFDRPAGGGSAFVNDVIDPNLVGGRAHVRPWWFVEPESWLSRISVGASLVGDVEAPTELERRTESGPEVSATRLPAVASDRATAIGGVDLALHLLDRDSLAVVPYGDLNVHFGLGHGLHTGVRADFEALDSVDLEGRFEFRSLSGTYLPEYVGPLYEIDRYQFFGWGVLLPTPKLRVAAGPRSSPVLGGYGELTGRFFDAVALSGAYADHQGPANANLRVSLRADPIDRVRLGAFYYKHNFDGLEAVTEREGTFVVTESRVRIYGPLYAKGAYSLLWQLRDDGVYRPIPRWTIGAGVSFGF